MNTKGLSEFFSKNWKFMAGLVGVLVIGLVIAGGWSERRKARERAASELLFEVQNTAQPLLASKKNQEAERLFEPVFEKFPGSRAAYEAALQLGDMWMDAGSYAEAVKRYDQAVGLAKDSFSTLLARYNLGIARESAGQYQEAVNDYDQALKVKGADFLRPEILMAQARCYESLKQGDKAAQVYQEIQAKFGERSSYYKGAASAFERQLGQTK